MSWEPYDYSMIYSEPYRIQQLTNNWRLPFPIVLVNACTFLFVMGIEFLFFRSFIGWVATFFNPANVFFYLGVPYACVFLLARLKPDGKKLHFYLWGVLLYTLQIGKGDCVYYNWEKVPKERLEPLFFSNQYVYFEEEESKEV